MLNVPRHGGPGIGRDELLTDWHLDPLVVLTLTVVAALWLLGRRHDTTRSRSMAFWGGLLAVAVALLGPLDAAAGVLLSAHMVQHVLLMLVAAPLLAVAAPAPVMLRGAPAPVRRLVAPIRRRIGLDPATIGRLRAPVARWTLFVGTLWLWHAAALYDAAVEHAAVHALEHVTFLATAFLAWSPLVGPARARLPTGLGILAVFTLGLQAGLLSALMTFSRSPWYRAHVERLPAWAPDALLDQQVAGVIMWVPAGLIHAAVAIALLARWLGETEAMSAARHRSVTL